MHRVIPSPLSPFLRRSLPFTPPSHSYRLRRRVHQIIQSLARLLHHFLRNGRQFLWHKHDARIQMTLQLQEAFYASIRTDGGTFALCLRVFGFLKHKATRISTLIDATYWWFSVLSFSWRSITFSLPMYNWYVPSDQRTMRALDSLTGFPVPSRI